ncbi:MAG: family transcriptional regulator, cyclic receptor protein [Actinomycetota bacterium]|nr:family transcriptional regulator, cyclic receptor protein [Actinomycetota bacterium]
MPPIVTCPILDALDPEDALLLIERGVVRDLARNDFLHLEGELSDERIHIVLDGVMKLSARDAEGRETILGLALEGDLVGEIAALGHAVHPYDAVAAAPSSLLGVDADALLSAVFASPTASRAFASALGERTSRIAQAAAERSTSEVPARLASRLLELADLLGRMRGDSIELELPFAQEELGRLAGMCRESACKTLRRFKSQGILDYSGKRLRIFRPDSLERIRCAGRA